MNLLLAEGGDGSWLYIIILVALFAVMIVPTVIRNKKENAKRQETMSQLKTGDSIITTAGVFGKIISIRETTIGKVFVISTGDADHVSYQEIHADAIMGIDTKRDIVLDADGNDITFAEEDRLAEEEKLEEIAKDEQDSEDVKHKEEKKSRKK